MLVLQQLLYEAHVCTYIHIYTVCAIWSFIFGMTSLVISCLCERAYDLTWQFCFFALLTVTRMKLFWNEIVQLDSF